MKWIEAMVRHLFPVRRTSRTGRPSVARLALTGLEDRVTPASVTWTGGGGDSNWSTAANWGGAAPTAGDDLVFADLGTPTATVNDFAAGTAFSSITVAGANYTIAGNAVVLTGGVAATYPSGSSNLALDIDLGGGQVSVASGGALDLTGAISGTAGLTVSGGGWLGLYGVTNNTYTGTTLVTDGILALDKNGATAVPGDLVVGDGNGGELVWLFRSNQIADSAYVAVGEGATLDLNGLNETIDALVLQGSTVTIGSGGALAIASSVSSFDAGNDTTSLIQGGTLDLGGDPAFAMVVNDDAAALIDLRITSVVANGGIVKSGFGILALAGANVYDGDTTVTSGAVQAESDTALGTTAGGTTVFGGASVFFDGPGLHVAEDFAISGSGYTGSGALATLNGTATLAGGVTLAANSQIGASFGSVLVLNGVIDDGLGAFDLTVLQASTGRTVLGGANTFDGNVNVDSGFLGVTNGGALGASGTSTTLSLASGATLELVGGVTLPATKALTLIGAGSGSVAKIVNLAGANTIQGSVTLAGNEAIFTDILTSLTVSGPIFQTGGSRGLTKSGAGALVLSGIGNYTGATSVLSGTLFVDGDISSSSGVSASGTGVVGGSGTLPAVTLSGSGTLAPGNGPGSIGIGGLYLGAGASLSIELNGPGAGTLYDQVGVGGTVSLAGALSISLGVTPAPGDTFFVVVNDGADPVSGTFAGLAEGATLTVNSTLFQISYAGGDGNDVTLTALSAATVAVLSSANPAVYGQPITFSTTVSGSGGVPTGNVSLVIDGTTVETLALVGGTATFSTITSLAVGAHTVGVSYAGSGTYTASSGSLSGGLTVGQAGSAATVVSSAPTSAPGQSVTFTATVSAVAPGAGTLTGTVQFFDGATLLGTVPVVAGTAAFTTSVLTVGGHTITAVYVGDVNFVGATSAPVSQTVAAGATTTTLTTSDAESDLRETVTFIATVTSGGPGTPAGTVTFSADGAVLGTVALNGSGVATFATAALASGARTITATFNPAGVNFLASAATLTQTVLPPRGNDVNGDGRADVIVGTATGSSHVKVFSGTDGSLVRSFIAFDGFQGGVSTAGGDTNADGRTDVIVGTATGSSHVKVFDGATGGTVRSFIAFDDYQGGVVVASGDVDGDGLSDVIVASTTGGTHVKVFSGADGSLIRSFIAFDGSRDGVSVAGGDIDGDGFDDLIVGTATGGAHVKVFSGRDGSLLRSYQAFENYLGGVTVAAGDIDGDGRADVVVGAATGSSHVKAFSGADGREVRSFLALPNFTGNMSLALGDVNGDGVLDIVAGSKAAGSTVTSVNGVSLNGSASFAAFDDYMGGIAVG